jgi:hypothetical protein
MRCGRAMSRFGGSQRAFMRLTASETPCKEQNPMEHQLSLLSIGLSWMMRGRLVGCVFVMAGL